MACATASNPYRISMEAVFQLSDQILLAQCRIDFFRAQGPGGQHVNRTDSAVRITHIVTGVVAQCQDHREKQRNQSDALRRLRIRLALVVRGSGRLAWMTECVRGGRIMIGVNALLFPAVIATACDFLQQHNGDLAATADALGCSSSQLAKLLRADKEVLQAANTLRAACGKGPIHGH